MVTHNIQLYFLPHTSILIQIYLLQKSGLNLCLGWDQKEINFGKINYDKYNLNKLDDEELKVHKDKMEGLFLKNYKDPKDRGFVYDIEVLFP